MQYMLMIYGSEAGEQAATPEQNAQMMAAYGAYSEALVKAGVMRGGDSSCRSIRLRPRHQPTGTSCSSRRSIRSRSSR